MSKRINSVQIWVWIWERSLATTILLVESYSVWWVWFGLDQRWHKGYDLGRGVLSQSVIMGSRSALNMAVIVWGYLNSQRFMWLETLKTMRWPDSQESFSWHGLLISRVRLNVSQYTNSERTSKSCANKPVTEHLSTPLPPTSPWSL